MISDAYARASDPETSHAAAASVRLTDLEGRVLEALRAFPQGLTSTEIAAALSAAPWSISPRLKPLREKGLVCDSGRRRKSGGSRAASIVWTIINRSTT